RLVYNSSVISFRRIAATVLGLMLALSAAAVLEPLDRVELRSRRAHGCSAGAPTGSSAALEPADAVSAAQHASSAGTAPVRARALALPVHRAPASGPASAFARPHDPPHLHAFSLLI